MEYLSRIIEAGPNGIEEAAGLIAKGGLVAYPTDTVYGLGCDPFNPDAVSRLIGAKGERNKPLPVLVAGIEAADEIAVVTEVAARLAQRFWPGPLTIVLRKRENLPRIVTAGEDTVGVRAPDHAVAAALIQRSGNALIGTSANITGRKPCISGEEVLGQLENRIDAILVGGQKPSGKESTVVRLEGKGFTILRRGPIPLHEIKKVISL